MSDTKKYKANQRIRKDGTLYNPGDTMTLTEEEALPLHVVPAPDAPDKPKVSKTMDANEAVAMIEDTPYEKLDGFVPDDESRVTVTRAWEKKQKEAREK